VVLRLCIEYESSAHSRAGAAHAVTLKNELVNTGSWRWFLSTAIYQFLPDSSSFQHRALMGCMLELSCFDQNLISPK
jgi:hypothetical protein